MGSWIGRIVGGVAASSVLLIATTTLTIAGFQINAIETGYEPSVPFARDSGASCLRMVWQDKFIA